MDIITDNFDRSSEKVILCTPYHFDDHISKLCTKTIKQILENQLLMNVSVFILMKYNFKYSCKIIFIIFKFK